MRDRFGPRASINIEAMVAEKLADWTPPDWANYADAELAAREMNELLGPFDYPEDEWTPDRMIDMWSEYAPADDNEAREWFASALVHEIKDAVNLPGPRSVYRRQITAKVARFLYCSGITRSGGGSSHWGRDPHGTVYMLPSWRHVLPRKGRLRPYVLWLPSDWWECQQAQGWRLRGRHKPGPFVHGLCGTCTPWPCCGATGNAHAPECVDKVFT